MKPIVRWLSVIAVATLSTGGAAFAADVHVMISAGFYGAYSELARRSNASSGHHLVTTRGPSMGDSAEAIPARLARGEAADVVILDGGRYRRVGPARIGAGRQQDRVRAFADRHGRARRRRKAGYRQRRGAPEHAAGGKVDRLFGQSAAALICRPRCFPSSASPTRSRARAEGCADRRPASRWPRSLRVARRRSASSRSAS